MAAEAAPSSPPELALAPADHLRGVSSIRFLCALWVFFNHGAWPPVIPNVVPTSRIAALVHLAYANVWNGPAAVIVFFVISGLCIHLPFARSLEPPLLGAFYSRRLLRLLIPIAVAVPLSRACGLTGEYFDQGVLWTLKAELIYYAIYPVLQRLRVRAGSWWPLVVASYGAALAVVLTNPLAHFYSSYGTALNWVLGLPCWLLGCVLAEAIQTRETRKSSRRPLWLWRGGIVGLAWFCGLLSDVSRVRLPWTLDVFALPATAWLEREIHHFRRCEPSALLEWAGEWSYSLYLLHIPMSSLFAFAAASVHGAWLGWSLLCLFVLTASVLFHLSVERPSHTFARVTSNWFRARYRRSSTSYEPTVRHGA